MKNPTLTLAGLGAIVGLILATLARPNLPIVGQPPVGIAFKVIFAPMDGMDRNYGSEFSSQLIMYIIAGAAVGFAVAFAISKLKEKS